MAKKTVKIPCGPGHIQFTFSDDPPEPVYSPGVWSVFVGDQRDFPAPSFGPDVCDQAFSELGIDLVEPWRAVTIADGFQCLAKFNAPRQFAEFRERVPKARLVNHG